MKRHRLLLLSLIVVALLAGGSGLWVWQAKRQYALNRQLIAAFDRRDRKQTLALVNAGADPNTPYDSPEPPTFRQLLNQLLHPASKPAEENFTAFRLVCGTAWYPKGYLPLVYGDYPEDSPLVEAMLAHGADANARGNQESILHSAVLCNHQKTVFLLLQHGADINLQNRAGLTPLMYAAAAGYRDMTRLLLNHHANVSLVDHGGRTALSHVVGNGMDKEIIRLLLAQGADPNLPDGMRTTPLIIAQQQHRPDIVALLCKGTK